MLERIVRVNMKTLTVSVDFIPDKWLSFGGRAMTSAIILDEVDPLAIPLGPSNKLIFAPGLLGGSTAPVSGRLSVGAKSPLTGTIKESNAGGQAGQVLARHNIRALIIEDKPANHDKVYTLEITKDRIVLVESPELKALGNYDTVAKLAEKYGKRKAAFITIGMAGEMGLTSASIACTDMDLRPTRHAGRGGLGAVMGSKCLKAIYLDDSETQMRQPNDEKAFKAACKKLAKALKEHPVTGEGLPTYGTNILQNIVNEVGGLPTQNFHKGSFEGAKNVSGEKQRELILQRGGKTKHACHAGCIIQCSRVFNDKKGKYLTKGPEYETVWALGPNCLIDDIDAIAKMDRMIDDIGIDSIDTGAAIAIAMESGIVPFGSAKGALKLLAEVRKGSPLGRVIGCGAKVTGQVFACDHVPVVKGQAMPAYDPRSIQGIGVTYATSTQGADHTAGYSITSNVLNVGGFTDPLKPEGQKDLSQTLQIATAAVDSTGFCLFISFALLDNPEAFEAVYELLNAFYGLNLGLSDISEYGRSVLRMEKKFNVAAGFCDADDRLPEWFKIEPIDTHKTVFSVTDEELDQVYDFV